MKGILIASLSILMFWPRFSESQVRQVYTDESWSVGNSAFGIFDIAPIVVDVCVDEDYIDDECGTHYDSPRLEDHFWHCQDMLPIWGVDAPESCYYPARALWFKKQFNISGEEFGCLKTARLRIQGDNSFVLVVNDFAIGSSKVSDWDRVFEFDVTDKIHEGENEILVQAVNIDGATCFNYAFMGLCLSLDLNAPPSPPEIELYPNPARNRFTLSVGGKNIIQNIKIYASDGRLITIMEGSFTNKIDLPVHRYTGGVYIIEFEVGEDTHHRPFVVVNN